MDRIVNLANATTTISAYTYGFDGIGNRTGIQEDGGEYSNWPYDGISQLSQDLYFALIQAWLRFNLPQWLNFTADDWDSLPEETSGTFERIQVYDPAGNLLTETNESTGEITTYTYDDANRMKTATDLSGTTTFTYDANGNQLTVEQPNGDITTNTWDGENHLVQVEHPDSTVIEYQYNTDGLRIQQDDGTDITRFLYDGRNLLMEIDDLGTVEALLTCMPLPQARLVSQYREGDSGFYHHDGHRNVTSLTDSAGVTTDEYAYNAWGQRLSTTGTTANAHTYGGDYVGYTQDPQAGPDSDFYLLGPRVLASQWHRFTTTDPITGGDPNEYRYAINNPINRSDPDGGDSSDRRQVAEDFHQAVRRAADAALLANGTVKSSTVSRGGARQMYQAAAQGAIRRGAALGLSPSDVLKRIATTAEIEAHELPGSFSLSKGLYVNEFWASDAKYAESMQSGNERFTENLGRTRKALRKIPHPLAKAVASALEQISGKQLTEAGDRLANQPAARDNMSGQFIEGVGQHGGEAIESLNALDQATRMADDRAVREFLKSEAWNSLGPVLDQISDDFINESSLKHQHQISDIDRTLPPHDVDPFGRLVLLRRKFALINERFAIRFGLKTLKFARNFDPQNGEANKAALEELNNQLTAQIDDLRVLQDQVKEGATNQDENDSVNVLAKDVHAALMRMNKVQANLNLVIQNRAGAESLAIILALASEAVREEIKEELEDPENKRAAEDAANDPEFGGEGEETAGNPPSEPSEESVAPSKVLDDFAELGFDKSKGFSSFKDFKKAHGEAGSGQAWHHIVEQTKNKGKFPEEILQNPENLIKLPHGKGTIHNKISGFYSSKQPFTGGLTVREWITKKSFKEQFEFGIQTIKDFGGSQYLPAHLR